jgi:hypothetical protein
MRRRLTDEFGAAIRPNQTMISPTRREIATMILTTTTQVTVD